MTYTREQLEAMDECKIDDILVRLVGGDGGWLTSDGMHALMMRIIRKRTPCAWTLSAGKSGTVLASVKIDRGHGLATHKSAPHALAIAFVLAEQESKA
jgi:hypothetical protein